MKLIIDGLVKSPFCSLSDHLGAFQMIRYRSQKTFYEFVIIKTKDKSFMKNSRPLLRKK
jgi:hypothetical protein